MTGVLALIATVVAILVAAYAPGFLAVRVLGGSRLLALAVAPALGAALAGISALLAPLAGIRWSALPFLLSAVLLIGGVSALRRWGVQLPATVLDGPLAPRGAVPFAGLWIVTAVAVAVVPIAVRAGRPDAILERWDTLYHLSALQRIRESGTASSFDVGSVSNSAGDPSIYPAGFHALATLAPDVGVPILLNGSVLALATVPWILGISLLARAVFPRIPWAPFAAALSAALIPASPLNLWIHLSPVPNLVGFAMLPGVLAAAAALWTTLLPRWLPASKECSDDWPRRSDRRPALSAFGTIGVAGVGLGLVHPNSAVTALILLTVLLTTTLLPHRQVRPSLLLLPVAALLPVAVMTYLPSSVTSFKGGLQVPWWTALGEVAFGLLTVWPMALGTVFAALWWPGLVSAFRTAHLWVGIAWVVIAVVYLDAAVDSPLHLSILFYRGQDRLAMPLAMLSAVLVVPGLQAWARLWRATGPDGRRRRASTSFVATLVVVGALLAFASVLPRLENAARNLQADYPGRGRFLQSDERELFETHVPQMDHDGTVLASPYSGAAHLYSMYGQDVRLPVLGMSYSEEDRELIYAVEDAAEDPEACALLRENGIQYVYQERRPYQHHATSDSVNYGTESLGRVLFETDHSRMIEIECDTGAIDDV